MRPSSRAVFLQVFDILGVKKNFAWLWDFMITLKSLNTWRLYWQFLVYLIYTADRSDLYGRSIRSNFSYFLINDFLIAILCILICFCNFYMFYYSFSRTFYTSQSWSVNHDSYVKGFDLIVLITTLIFFNP